MKLFTVIAENWKMDGGVAFGVVPKSIWKKLAEPDENNMVKITSRSILIETDRRLILFDTGMGRKQDEKYYRYRYLFGAENLDNSFRQIGYKFSDVTDVIFTHLHDDHCGGALKFNPERISVPVFENAMHYCSESQWNWAINPNKREIGSFFKENFVPLQENRKLELIKDEGEFLPGIQLRIFNGHTRGMLVPVISLTDKTFVFAGDFIPSAAHIPLPYIASVDIEPLVALQEKEQFLNEAVANGYYLIFEHDFDVECCTVKHTEKGVRIDKTFRLKDILNQEINK